MNAPKTPLENDSAPLPHGFVPLCREIIERYIRYECAVRAQALSFVGLVSLVPVMLCILAAFSFVIRDPQHAEAYLRTLMKLQFPGREAANAVDELVRLTNLKETVIGLKEGKWWATVFGAGSLIWTDLSLIMSAVTPMNAVWHVKETRSIPRLFLVCLGVLFVTGALFLLSFVPTFVPHFVNRFHLPLPWLTGSAGILLPTLCATSAAALDIGMFVIFYKWLPNTTVSWRAAAFGGVIAGLAWEVSKYLFALYLEHFTANRFYGAMAGAFLLVTWIYYSCSVLLIGPILCKMFEERRRERGVPC